ncbi:MAG TPA: permease-like cell division protein FtsX [Candidatus Paceibacterota bacterium]|nr:permease-like cell division protein FtsX [Candidatus Paceibacterota bacterium]
MFWVRLQRVVRSGWINFRRNRLVSYAAILVTTITLSVATAILLFQAVLTSAITQVQNKVDIAVYFTVDAPEDSILALKSTLEKLPEVANVQYTSADQQVLDFRDRHADDYLTLEALDELGDNPFGGSLLIKAKDSTQYEAIAQVLQGDSQVARDNAQIIDRINYSQNKLIIDRLNTLIRDARTVGLGITAVLALISIVIVFTTVRLTIYVAREEIGIMRLVGASSGYVRAPFLVEGILYGFFAFVIATALFLPLTYVIGVRATDILGFNLYTYYTTHFLSIGGLVLLVGIFLGWLSSFLAVHRYLNV